MFSTLSQISKHISFVLTVDLRTRLIQKHLSLTLLHRVNLVPFSVVWVSVIRGLVMLFTWGKLHAFLPYAPRPYFWDLRWLTLALILVLNLRFKPMTKARAPTMLPSRQLQVFKWIRLHRRCLLATFWLSLPLWGRSQIIRLIQTIRVAGFVVGCCPLSTVSKDSFAIAGAC